MEQTDNIVAVTVTPADNATVLDLPARPQRPSQSALEPIVGVPADAPVTTSNALLRALITEIVAAAVTDIRQGDAAIVKSIQDLNNTVMGLKNTLITMNKLLTEKQKNGRGAVVYINNNAPPNDLFGNNNKEPIEHCD